MDVQTGDSEGVNGGVGASTFAHYVDLDVYVVMNVGLDVGDQVGVVSRWCVHGCAFCCGWWGPCSGEFWSPEGGGCMRDDGCFGTGVVVGHGFELSAVFGVEVAGDVGLNMGDGVGPVAQVGIHAGVHTGASVLDKLGLCVQADAHGVSSVGVVCRLGSG